MGDVDNEFLQEKEKCMGFIFYFSVSLMQSLFFYLKTIWFKLKINQYDHKLLAKISQKLRDFVALHYDKTNILGFWTGLQEILFDFVHADRCCSNAILHLNSSPSRFGLFFQGAWYE